MKWFPALHQLDAGVKNPNYFNSVFIGIIVVLMHFPRLVWQLVLSPIFMGFFELFLACITPIYLGFKGKLRGNNLTRSEAIRKFVSLNGK